MAAIFPANGKPWWQSRRVGTHHLSALPWKKRHQTAEQLARPDPPFDALRAGGLEPAS
jgi:hypothetical protein